ncbi:hypothetical protein SADUNF_Sadunf09G0087100 [Salix dunnii]|uniref:Response regulatory domain-containing protein n=1 Tax=Salix dunnii TaxID=1413687 RepID=A0A835JW27_9ROSI|nr:hypothetical protein SADUNF_Sadunf09G0087100 [Salix dunnii]
MVLFLNHKNCTYTDATKQLRKVGLKSQIIGITSESEVDQQAFMDAGLDNCVEKPLDPVRTTVVFPNSKK